MNLYFIFSILICLCIGIMYYGTKLQHDQKEQEHRHKMELMELDLEDAYAKGYNDGYVNCMRKHGYEPIDEQSDS